MPFFKELYWLFQKGSGQSLYNSVNSGSLVLSTESTFYQPEPSGHFISLNRVDILSARTESTFYQPEPSRHFISLNRVDILSAWTESTFYQPEPSRHFISLYRVDILSAWAVCTVKMGQYNVTVHQMDDSLLGKFNNNLIITISHILIRSKTTRTCATVFPFVSYSIQQIKIYFFFQVLS